MTIQVSTRVQSTTSSTRVDGNFSVSPDTFDIPRAHRLKKDNAKPEAFGEWVKNIFEAIWRSGTCNARC